MCKPNYWGTESSLYYYTQTIEDAAFQDVLSGAIRAYVSSRFSSSKDVDALLSDLAKEIAECINDEYIEHVNKRALEVLSLRLRELAQQTIMLEIHKHIESVQKSCIGLIDEGFVKKVLSFVEHNKNE